MRVEFFYKSAIFCMCLLTFISLFRALFGNNPIFEDLDIYARAVNDYLNDVNPYRADVLLLFIYHPYVLKILIFINNFISLGVFLPMAYLCSACFFFWQLIDFIQTRKSLTKAQNEKNIYWVIFPAIAFGSSAISSFLVGNVSIYIHFLLLGTFFWSYKNKSISKTLVYSFLIFLAAIIKPYFLAYLILLVYLTSIKNCITVSLTVTSLVTVSWLSTMIILPEVHENFLRALYEQTLKSGDVGFSFFGYLNKHHNTATSLLVHSTILLMAFWLTSLSQTRRRGSLRSEEIIPLAIIFIIILNPRMKAYDFPIAVIFTYVFLFLQNQSAFFRVVFISSMVAFLPRLHNYLSKLGFIEQIDFLSNWKLFDILGFLIALFFSFYYLRRIES